MALVVWFCCFWSPGFGTLTLVGSPRHFVCGLLISAFRPGHSVLGRLSWVSCEWFSGPAFLVLALWPWLFCSGLVAFDGWPLSLCLDFAGFGSGIVAPV